MTSEKGRRRAEHEQSRSTLRVCGGAARKARRPKRVATNPNFNTYSLGPRAVRPESGGR